MRVARSVKLLAAHRRREAVLSESTRGMKEVRVLLTVPVAKRPAVLEKFSPVFHSDYNECETGVKDSLLE